MSNEAKKINQPLGEKETDISDRLELSIDDVRFTIQTELQVSVLHTLEKRVLFSTA